MMMVCRQSNVLASTLIITSIIFQSVEQCGCFSEDRTKELVERRYRATAQKIGAEVFLDATSLFNSLFRKQILAEKLGSRLHRIAREASAFEEVEKGFASLNIRIREVDPLQELKNVGEKLGRMVNKRIVAVKRLVDFAEQRAKDHKWEPTINISYHNAKEPDSKSGLDSIDFTKDARFYNDAVNLQSSTVHVPTNVFARSPMIQNGAFWSSKLDTMFRYNFYDDPSLKSQYFASYTGLLRMYPGVRWSNTRDLEKPDMYDCRLTSWYIRAASSPKDIVILLDISGSMTGRRKDTARKTALEIMNTLNEDDFFNILTFKDNTNFLDPCTNGSLVQATDLTKQRFAKLMLEQTTINYANYTVALPVAFQLLLENSTSRSSSCNKAIMIISDNAPSAFEDICSVYNPERHVRFFSYVIGREVTEYSEMTEIACNNRGYAAHIVTMSDVRDYVEEYYHVLARPMVLYKNHTNIWTSAYWHARNTLGMVVTAAQPVFNRSDSAGRTGSLLGVMGVDVPTDDFIRELDPHKWGIGSYVFATNHNGRVIFHPQWKKRVIDGYLRPDRPEIDISDIELETNRTRRSDESKLRTSMIDQSTGTHQMQILRQLDDGKRVYERDYQYYYTGVPETPFSVGLAIPVGMGRPYSAKLQMHSYAKLEKVDRSVFDNTMWTVHPSWFYCNLTLLHFNDTSSYLKYILEQSSLEPDRLNATCDLGLVEALILDMKATHAASVQWFSKIKDRGNLYNLYEISTCFTITRAGLTRWKDQGTNGFNSSQSQWTADDSGFLDEIALNATDQTGKHFLQMYSKAVDESFYERTVSSGAEMTITVPLQNGANVMSNVSMDWIMATLPVVVEDGKQNSAPVAITGILMRSAGLMNLLMQLSKTTCTGSDTCVSCDNPSVSCYLLDESGYVVADTQFSENSGKFFGIIQGEIMESLIEWEVFKRYLLKDTQGLCPSSRKDRSASAIFRPWIFGFLTGLRVLAETLYRYAIVFGSAVFAADEYYSFELRENYTEADILPLPPPFPCESQYTLFHSVWSELKLVYGINCTSGCTKKIGVFKVSLTNMILIAADSPRSCLCNDVRISTAPTEVQYTPEETCENSKFIPYRRKPKDCFAYYKDEDASSCGRPWVPSSDDSSSAIFPRLSAFLSILPFSTMIVKRWF